MTATDIFTLKRTVINIIANKTSNTTLNNDNNNNNM